MEFSAVVVRGGRTQGPPLQLKKCGLDKMENAFDVLLDELEACLMAAIKQLNVY